MDESESKKENQKDEERRFSQEQYEMLKRCSEKKDMTEWNERRMRHSNEDILLEGADFFQSIVPFYLRGVHLNQRSLHDGKTGKILRVNSNVYMKGCHFENAILEKAELSGSDLENANFRGAHLEGSRLRGARLRSAIAWSTHFENANLSNADLELADLQGGYLQGTYIKGACLQGANFHLVHVDGSTIIWKCKVNHDTDFSGVALDDIRIDPATKQLLEYNIRRKNWDEWYKKNPHWSWFVRAFWWISDYGISTKRVISVFFSLALIFASIYYLWGRMTYPEPGIVENLFEVEKATGEVVLVPAWLVPLRTLYFSIVTMTTLGFGDMYANANSIWGHILLSIQVILGYVLLGALVTRFAVLFTAGGPAGRFEDEKKKKKTTDCTEE